MLNALFLRRGGLRRLAQEQLFNASAC
jgi:hypothetical protein